jgi:hypothetical protein
MVASSAAIRSTAARSTPASAVAIAELGEPLEERAGRRCEVQPVGAAIVRVGPALDQSTGAESIQKARQRDRLQVEHFSELGLLEPLEPVEPREDRPLCPRHAEPASFLISIGSQHASHIIE